MANTDLDFSKVVAEVVVGMMNASNHALGMGIDYTTKK